MGCGSRRHMELGGEDASRAELWCHCLERAHSIYTLRAIVSFQKGHELRNPKTCSWAITIIWIAIGERLISHLCCSDLCWLVDVRSLCVFLSQHPLQDYGWCIKTQGVISKKLCPLAFSKMNLRQIVRVRLRVCLDGNIDPGKEDVVMKLWKRMPSRYVGSFFQLRITSKLRRTLRPKEITGPIWEFDSYIDLVGLVRERYQSVRKWAINWTELCVYAFEVFFAFFGFGALGKRRKAGTKSGWLGGESMGNCGDAECDSSITRLSHGATRLKSDEIVMASGRSIAGLSVLT